MVALAALDDNPMKYGLDNNDPFVRFFRAGGDIIENYLRLDDFAAWALIERLSICNDETAREFAIRIRDRRLLKCIDINTRVPMLPLESNDDLAKRRQEEMARIEARVGSERIGVSIFRDTESISVYGEVGGDVAKKHKKLSIKISDGTTREITQLSPAINTLAGKRAVVRYFCSDDSTKRLALGE